MASLLLIILLLTVSVHRSVIGSDDVIENTTENQEAFELEGINVSFDDEDDFFKDLDYDPESEDRGDQVVETQSNLEQASEAIQADQSQELDTSATQDATANDVEIEKVDSAQSQNQTDDVSDDTIDTVNQSQDAVVESNEQNATVQNDQQEQEAAAVEERDGQDTSINPDDSSDVLADDVTQESRQADSNVSSENTLEAEQPEKDQAIQGEQPIEITKDSPSENVTSDTEQEDAQDASGVSDDVSAAQSVIPQAPEEQVEQVVESEDFIPEEDEIQGIDTLSLDEPQGNWLFKRIWWERAEGRYNKIRESVEQINDSRINFFALRAELDKSVFDPFYLEIGFSQGELHAALTELIAVVEKEKEEDGVLSDQESDLLARAKQELEFLQKLRKDAESMQLFDKSADEVLERVMEQKMRIAAYEKEAWAHMREIARILSDEQARDLYYKMDAAWRNIKAIQQYLQNDLSNYFTQLITDAKEHVERIKAGVQGLKEKGIDLKAQIQQATQEEDMQDDYDQEEDDVDQAPQKVKKYNGAMGTVRWIVDSISGIVLWLPRLMWNTISSLF